MAKAMGTATGLNDISDANILLEQLAKFLEDCSCLVTLKLTLLENNYRFNSELAKKIDLDQVLKSQVAHLTDSMRKLQTLVYSGYKALVMLSSREKTTQIPMHPLSPALTIPLDALFLDNKMGCDISGDRERSEGPRNVKSTQAYVKHPMEAFLLSLQRAIREVSTRFAAKSSHLQSKWSTHSAAFRQNHNNIIRCLNNLARLSGNLGAVIAKHRQIYISDEQAQRSSTSQDLSLHSSVPSGEASVLVPYSRRALSYLERVDRIKKKPGVLYQEALANREELTRMRTELGLLKTENQLLRSNNIKLQANVDSISAELTHCQQDLRQKIQDGEIRDEETKRECATLRERIQTLRDKNIHLREYLERAQSRISQYAAENRTLAETKKQLLEKLNEQSLHPLANLASPSDALDIDGGDSSADGKESEQQFASLDKSTDLELSLQGYVTNDVLSSETPLSRTPSHLNDMTADLSSGMLCENNDKECGANSSSTVDGLDGSTDSIQSLDDTLAPLPLVSIPTLVPSGSGSPSYQIISSEHSFPTHLTEVYIRDHELEVEKLHAELAASEDKSVHLHHQLKKLASALTQLSVRHRTGIATIANLQRANQRLKEDLQVTNSSYSESVNELTEKVFELTQQLAEQDEQKTKRAKRQPTTQQQASWGLW
jgi:hypothetical protein